MIPGEVIVKAGEIELNAGRETASVKIANKGDRPVQVGSHYHFFEVNKLLSFDRAATFGKRLDIPAGTSVRFEPGEEKTVELVEIGGRHRVFGLNNLTDAQAVPASLKGALHNACEKGFVEAKEA